MSTPSINTDVIDNTTSYNISNIENAPPETSKSSTSQKSFKGYAQPLSPRPININIANTTQSPSGGGSVSFHPDTRQNYNNLHQQQLSSSSQSSTRYKDQIFQLNLEIQSLKQRLSLTSSTSKNELLDLLSEKDAVIGNKSRQISALNDKFNKITKAVNGMEREMKTLRKAKKDADDECKKINRYLGIREKEVNVLVSRCAAQEEKLNEMKSSRMLEKELSALRKMKDKQMDDHGKEIKGLMGDLQQLGNEKQALKNEILSLEEKNIVVQEELDATKAEVQQKCDKISSLYDELKGLHESKEKESTDCIAMRKNLQDVKHELFERESELDELETVHKNEINRLRREIENRTASGEESLEKYRAMKEVEFDNLKRDLQSKQLEFEHTMDDLKHCRRKHETVQKELTALEMKQDTLSLLTKQEAEANENERISLENQLTEKNKELQELEGFNRELKDENESNAMQMKKLKEKLGFLENEIREMTEKEMSVIESQNEKMSTIYKLEENIQQLKEEKTKMAKSYKAKIEELELEAIETQESLAINMQEHEAKLSEINHELSMERTKAENHWADLEQARSKSSKQEELRKVEMKLLEESVKAAKAQTRSKEDEFRKMRNGEMKLAKEKARKLEEKVAEMEKVCEETEMDAAMIVDDMNKKMVKAAEKHAKLEEEKCAIMNESRKAIEALEGKIANFENDFSSLKKELAVRSEKLAERDARIEGMMKAKKAQDEDVESWRNDLDTLINAYEKCKIDHTATVQRIQGDYDDFKTKAQSDISVFQKDYETLQALAAETEEKYEQQSTELSETKTALDDRTRVLGEMIECQKALEEELKEARNMIAELQDVSDSFNKQNEDYRNRYLSLQLQMEKDLNHHLDEVERKNNLTVELERKIKKVDKELVEVRAELKATEELRAENYLLKDKVDRQENFLKRKLEKEKKQRLVPRSIGSPPRTNPPRSRSVTRRPSDIPQKSSQSKPKKSRSRSHSTNRRSSSSGDELEELLM